MFDRWRGNSVKNHYPLLLTTAGEELSAAQLEAYPRTVTVLDGHAYVTGFDQEEGEAFVARIPQPEVQTYIKEHPVASVTLSEHLIDNRKFGFKGLAPRCPSAQCNSLSGSRLKARSV